MRWRTRTAGLGDFREHRCLEAHGTTVADLPQVLLNNAAMTYWFVANGRRVVGVAKVGTYTGGQFYFASCNSCAPSETYLRHDTACQIYRTQLLAYSPDGYGAGGVLLTADSESDWRHSGQEGDALTGKAYYLWPSGHGPYTQDPNTGSPTYANHPGSMFYARCPNTFNGLVPMSPVHIFMKRASGRWSYIGYPEGIRVINCVNYPPAEPFLKGTDVDRHIVWIVFHKQVS